MGALFSMYRVWMNVNESWFYCLVHTGKIIRPATIVFNDWCTVLCVLMFNLVTACLSVWLHLGWL